MVESICPDCGSIACSTGDRIKGRVIWACSNLYCGLFFYRLDGKIIQLKYEPLLELPIGGSPVSKVFRDCLEE